MVRIRNTSKLRRKLIFSINKMVANIISCIIVVEELHNGLVKQFKFVLPNEQTTDIKIYFNPI